MYLVTGGGGFIGSHLVQALVQRGERTRVLDNEYSGSRERIAAVLADVEWISGDIRNPDVLQRACAGVEVVLHHAAIASVPRSVAEPMMTHAVNCTGTLNVLQAAQATGVRRVVFASSSAVYGDLATNPKHEDLPTRPLSPYGAQKLAAEAYCAVWNATYALETVMLRYFNVFGPRQDPQSEYAAVIPRFITAALAGRNPTIYGDGEQSRDFISVDDIVAINLLAATVPNAAGHILNVGSGWQVTLNELIAALGDVLGRAVVADYLPARAGDIRASGADISRLQQVLGYAPTQTFAAGLAQTVAYYAQPGIS